MAHTKTERGYFMGKYFKVFLVFVFLSAFILSLVACERNDNNLPRNINRALVGTWELSESNMWGVSDTVTFRSDGTGTMGLSAVREEFTWSVDGDELIIVQGGGLLTVAYTITMLNNTTLSYEADIPGLGFIRVTYIKR
ncbi:MAG: DUF5640 domain-containing protein [Defluviitaleaceae bacterium]|nr:DUF5640 domain-containing protein [Defluviitaleaceae bacterium]